jgi:hypothetical protein
MRTRRKPRSAGLRLWLLACVAVGLLVLPGSPDARPNAARSGIAHAATITPTIAASFPVPGNRARGLTWGDGSLWLVDEDENVYRLNPESGAVQATFPITFTPDGLAWDGANLWAGSGWGGGAKRLDAPGKIVETLPQAGYWPNSGLAWSGDNLYVGDYNLGEIHKHTRSGAHTLSWEIPQGSGIEHPTGMAFDGNALWIGESCEGFENNIAQFSLDGNLLATIDLGLIGQGIKDNETCIWPEIKGLAWDGQYLWYTANDLFTIYKLNIGAAPEPPPPESIYVHAVDPNGQPVGSALVYQNGALIVDDQGIPRLTDAAGNLVLDSAHIGDTLVVLAMRHQQPTARQIHNGWGYRTYITSLAVGGDGSLQPYRVTTTTQGPRMLTVAPTNTLVLLNLVVSIEWEATKAYLDMMARAVRSASDYLYDVTDGQMAFGEVAIYNDAEHWADADIQIAASNIVRPHAHIGGIEDDDRSHVMRLGRAWDGQSGDRGSWDAPDGYRTISHELGHYALHLYDEYFGYIYQNGKLVGERAAACTGPSNHNPATDASNVSIMDFQYASSELAMRGVAGMWSNLCELTAQWQINGESDWQTVIRKYADKQVPARWRLSTPADRGGVVAGPAGLPTNILNLPLVDLPQSEASEEPRQLTVYQPNGVPLRNAIVALYRKSGRVIGQGLTDNNGRIDLYGAGKEDVVRAASFDGGLAGDATVSATQSMIITLRRVGGLTTQATGAIPHMQIIALPGQSPDQIELLIRLKHFDANTRPSVLITAPGSQVGFAPILSHRPITDTYEGQASFDATERGTGRIQVFGKANGDVVSLQSTYRLQRVVNSQGNDAYANDGNLDLRLEEGALPGSETYMVVMPPGAIPGLLPAGLTLIGDLYDVTASWAATLDEPALLTLHYDKALVTGAETPAGLKIYRWNPNSASWQAVGGTIDPAQRAVTAQVTALGTYALLAPLGSWAAPRWEVFLPLTRR